MFIMDNSSSKLEIRLFYVRILPCIVSTVPDHLSLNILRPDHHSTSLEINASLIPSSQPATVTLRRDRVDEDTSEVTYVTTDCLRIVGGVEFEVLDVEEVVLCGALERLDCATTTLSGGIKVGGGAGGWTMDCFTTANGVGNGRGKKKGFCSSQSIEVYVAGRCYNMPVILTKTVQAISPRQKRNGGLDVIFEDEERKEQNDDELALQPKWEASETELDGYEPEGKLVPNYYSEDMYTGEDGQLTWFNAGVRVGVGIGLGMCLGVGIGVGLLMRSYQATTRNFKRRFI